MERIGNFFRAYFKTRTVGFYIMLGAALVALVQNFVYYGTYHDVEMVHYFSTSAFIVPFIAFVACLAMSLFSFTDRWAALVLFGLEVCAFMLFIQGTYMYLSGALYGGLNAAALASLNGGFLSSAILYVVVLIASGVAVFMPARKQLSKIPEENTLITEEE